MVAALAVKQQRVLPGAQEGQLTQVQMAMQAPAAALVIRAIQELAETQVLQVV